MTTLLDLLSQLRGLGVQLSVDGERLRLNAPKGVLTPDLQADLSARKMELIAFLKQTQQTQAAAVPVLDRSQILPLSIAQERIWNLARLDPTLPMYTMYLSYEIFGKLDSEALETALGLVAQRHEILRSCYPSIQGVPQMQISPAVPWRLGVEALPELQHDPQAVQDYVLVCVREPFDLEQGPLVRVHLAQLTDERWILSVVMHHIIADGWSWAIFLRELSLCYAQVLARKTAELPALVCQYVDLAAWQRQHIASDQRHGTLEYWQKRLQGLPDQLALPYDNPSIQARYQGARLEQQLTSELSAALRELSQSQGVTLYTTLLAAWAATLAAASEQTELTICTPMASRTNPESQQLIGYFNTIVPLRLELRSSDTFRSLIGQTQQRVQAAYAHQEIGYEQLAEQSSAVRRALAHMIFVLQDSSSQSLELTNAQVRPIPVYAGVATFDCFVNVYDQGATLAIVAEYKTERYSATTIQALLDAYLGLLTQLIAHPDLALQRDSWRSSTARPGKAREYGLVAARTPLEAELQGIWTRILGIEQIGVLDSFFELGGDSLLALRLVTRIEEQLGVNLPLAALIHEPDIAHMAALIESGGHNELWRPLVALQPHGSQPPFFAVHGVHGNILFWRDLVSHLGPNQPFYALQSRGIDGFQEPLRSIPAMAEWYIREIKTVQPQGPYYLGGYSLGGEIAFEMARQLQAMGEQVAFLVLLDTMNPDRPIRRAVGRDRSTGVQQNQRRSGLPVLNILSASLQIFVTHTRPFSGALSRQSVLLNKIRGHLHRMDAMPARQKIAYLYADARMRIQRKLRRRQIAAYQRQRRRLAPDILLWYLEDCHTAALLAYAPEPYAGRLTLFRTRESLPHNPLNSPSGWEALALGGCDLHLFDSPHRMVDEAYIGELADRLRSCLALAQEKLSSRDI